MDSPPGILPPVPDLQPLGPISPSRFVGLQACALREVLAANHAPVLLPSAPAARLGSIVHRLLEEAGRGRFGIPVRADIEARWEELISASEQSASRSWLDRHLLPLRAAIPDFEVRRLRAVSGAMALAAATVTTKPVTIQSGQHQLLGYELAIATPDGQAAGRIDAVVASGDGPIIRDYKSGAIYEVAAGELAIKEAYSSQLKLYAAMYAAMAGTWPSRLELAPVGGDTEPVEFTADECVSLLVTAVQLRDETNRVVNSRASTASKMWELAAPAPATCAHCLYRPLCGPYEDALASGTAVGWPNDVRGELRAVQVLGNSRLMVLLDAEGETIRIRGVDPEPARHPALGLSRSGDPIAVYSLRPAGSATSFAEGPYTVFYKLPSDLATSDSTFAGQPQ